MEFLDQDVRDHGTECGWLLTDPLWKGISTDSRFVALEKKVGLVK